MDNYLAFITIIFLLLFTLVLRQKMKIDLKKQYFEPEKSILKDRQSIKERRAKIKDMVCNHVAK
ncbi:MAG: hypothetical protein U9Q92_05430 [archaeon]|nr:hypothetical protein [archaeon]